MGCSPSKGKLFSKPESPGLQKALPAEAPLDAVEGRPVEVENKCLKTEQKENELPPPAEECHTKETACLAVNQTSAQMAENIQEKEVNVMPLEIVSDVVQTDKIKKMEKRKKNKGNRRSTDKKRKSSIAKTKVDFPPHMVRAHQAAYTFLNPNISKYETLLGLMDQATQTQLSLQPMMSGLVLRFEEINQALEEMAEEGELMLKEHGDYMALPSGMMGPTVMSAKPSTDRAQPPDPPPDLLQQLLQHSTEKMRQVAGSVQALGETTLEEAVEYYSSLSKMLVEKLQAKQTAEKRLAQVLARVEVAAMRKSNPEDSALHSEDSGIGGENESLTGSERHRRHRGSAGSGSCGSGANVRGAFDNLAGNSPNLVGHNEDDEEDEEEDDDDDEEYEDDESDRPQRKRSSSSPPDPSQALRYMHANYIQQQQSTVKRPLTAAKPEHASSTRCATVMMELQRNQKDLDQRIQKMSENKELAGPLYNVYRAGLRRHSLNGSAGAHKGPLRINQPPCSLPMIAPQPPKRQTVRRLINSFSQGVDGRPGQSLANVPPHIRRPKKSGVLLLSDTVTRNEGGLVINGNNNNNSWPDSRDDLDMDNLPPPPPEVLMDNSFQSTEGLLGNEEGLQGDSGRTLPMINQKAGISQRLKASVQNVEVLPNRAGVRPRSIAISPACPVRQDDVMGVQDEEQQQETDVDPDTEKANCLYQQARKIIHLRDAVESTDRRNIVERRGTLSHQDRMGQRCESTEYYEDEMPSCSPPVTAPPVSRVRLPPSGPSVRHRYPSPPVFRPQSTSSRPSSPRTIVRATDNPPEEIIPSVSFRDARSVFSRNDSQNSQACLSSGSSVLPRPWGEASRGRLTTRGIGSSTRRTQSEQRPSMTSHAEFCKDVRSTQAKEKEPVVSSYSHPGHDKSQASISYGNWTEEASWMRGETFSTHTRPGSPLLTGNDDQLDPSAAVMTA